MKLKGFLVSLFFCCLLSYGKSPEDKEKIVALFKKTANFYDSKNSFQVDLSYMLCPTATSNQIVEKYKGYLAKKNKGGYVKIDKTEFITDEKNSLKIDNESKLIQMNSKEASKNEDLFYDIKKYLTNFSNFTLTSNDNEWICTMTTPAVTFIPYTKVVIFIDKKSNSITKEVFYLIVKNKYKAPNGEMKNDYPRIEISMKNFTSKIKNEELFKIGHYINSKHGKIFPIGTYKSYKIVE